MVGKAHMAIGGATTQPGEDVSSDWSVLAGEDRGGQPQQGQARAVLVLAPGGDAARRDRGRAAAPEETGRVRQVRWRRCVGRYELAIGGRPGGRAGKRSLFFARGGREGREVATQ